MEIYQRQEEARLEGMKDALRKLVVYETACLRNLQYDIDNLAHVIVTKAMESVNIKSDLRLFIDQNVDSAKENSFAFVPYQGTHPAFTGLGAVSPIATIPHASARTANDLLPGQLDSIVEKAWTGSGFDAEDEANFRAAIKEVAGRRVWAESVTSRRLAGRFALNKSALEQVTEQVLQILTESQRENDASVAKVVIMAVNSFYCETEGNKVFVHARVAHHPVWQQPLFWEQAIERAIDEELKRGSEQAETVRNAAFCQLGTFAHSMLTFAVDRMLTNELISKLACKYDLSDEDLTTLSEIIVKSNEVQRGVPSWLEQIPVPERVRPLPLPIPEELKAEEEGSPDEPKAEDSPKGSPKGSESPKNGETNPKVD
jgi:hypothetical protein